MAQPTHKPSALAFHIVFLRLDRLWSYYACKIVKRRAEWLGWHGPRKKKLNIKSGARSLFPRKNLMEQSSRKIIWWKLFRGRVLIYFCSIILWTWGYIFFLVCKITFENEKHHITLASRSGSTVGPKLPPNKTLSSHKVESPDYFCELSSISLYYTDPRFLRYDQGLFSPEFGELWEFWMSIRHTSVSRDLIQNRSTSATPSLPLYGRVPILNFM